MASRASTKWAACCTLQACEVIYNSRSWIEQFAPHLMVIPLYHSMNVVNTGLQQIYNNMHEHGETFFSMRHQVICQHHPCFSTMLFGMASLLHQVLYGSKNLHQCLGCGLASPLVGPSQACVLQILHTCWALVRSKERLWQRPLTVFGFNFSVAVVVAVVCLTLSRHGSFFPITTNVVMQSSKNTMECHVIRSRIWHKEVGKGRPHWNTMPSAEHFQSPCAKDHTPVCKTNHPTQRTCQSKRLRIPRSPTCVGPSPQQNSTWWRRVFLEDSSCPWATYSQGMPEDSFDLILSSSWTLLNPFIGPSD